MAIKIAEARAKVYGSLPDKKVQVEFEDGSTHEWTLKNSGALLRVELVRLGEEMRTISSISGEGATAEQQAEIMDGYHQAVERFGKAFNSSVTSEDGSAAKFFEENKEDLQIVMAVISSLINYKEER